MSVTSLGDNLNVVICVKRTFAHDWMSFGLWYSLSKNAPDAVVFLRFEGMAVLDDLFHWPTRFGVKVVRGEVPGKTLVLPPHVVMARELNGPAVDYLNQTERPELGEELCCEAKGERFSPFIDYQGGCGVFNWPDWIDKYECPYDDAEGLMTHDATLNEVKVLQVWTQLGPIYSTISRG